MNETTLLATIVVILFFLCLYFVDEFLAVILKAIGIFIVMLAIGWIVGIISAAIICIDTGELPWYAQYLGIFN